MKTISFIIGIASVFLVVSCGEAEQNTVTEPVVKKEIAPEVNTEVSAIMEKARTFFEVLPNAAENPNNLLTAEKIALGKALYMDTRLSLNNTQSCNTCHNVETYGVDNLPTSPGDLGGNGDRNSPTSFNAALHMTQFWDGRSPDVEDQAGGPILNPVEMNMPSEEAVVDRLLDIDEYVDMFAEAFPGSDEEISYDNLKMAIGAFERTLLTPAPFDDYLAGNQSAITSEQEKGIETFIEAGCITCHSGALLGGSMYQKFGVYGDYWDLTKSEKIDEGRFVVTGLETDKYMFKVPSLRNITMTAPYFHDGSVNNLNDAISMMAKLQVNKDLTPEEVESIALFLETLTGDAPEI